MKHYLFGRTRSAHVQFFRYLVVGGSSAVLHLSVYGFLTEIVQMHYLWANTVAFVFGLTWNYLFGLLWIFDSRHGRRKEFLMVFLISLAGLGWNQLLLYGFIEFGGLHQFLANFIAIWIVLFWNFGMRKVYVFH